MFSFGCLTHFCHFFLGILKKTPGSSLHQLVGLTFLSRTLYLSLILIVCVCVFICVCNRDISRFLSLSTILNDLFPPQTPDIKTRLFTNESRSLIANLVADLKYIEQMEELEDEFEVRGVEEYEWDS